MENGSLKMSDILVALTSFFIAGGVMFFVLGYTITEISIIFTMSLVMMSVIIGGGLALSLLIIVLVGGR